jgi:hypothetical protein
LPALNEALAEVGLHIGQDRATAPLRLTLLLSLRSQYHKQRWMK